MAKKTKEANGISIQIPAHDMTEAQIGNLRTLLEIKGGLIRNALGIGDLPVERIGDRLDFPWFPADSTPEEIRTYMRFITALVEMAKKQKRINAVERHCENEKYAFRCFLLRLGFIGDEYKTDRKLLMRNLHGSAAFKKLRAKEADSHDR